MHGGWERWRQIEQTIPAHLERLLVIMPRRLEMLMTRERPRVELVTAARLLEPSPRSVVEATSMDVCGVSLSICGVLTGCVP
jgi:hypothetical protein